MDQSNLTEHKAVIGRTRDGMTAGLSETAEQLVTNGHTVVILDPKGGIGEIMTKHAGKTFIIGMIIWTAIAILTKIDENIAAFILRSLGPQTDSMIGSMAKMAAFFSGYIVILFVLAGSWYGYLVLKDKASHKMSSETPS